MTIAFICLISPKWMVFAFYRQRLALYKHINNIPQFIFIFVAAHHPFKVFFESARINKIQLFNSLANSLTPETL